MFKTMLIAFALVATAPVMADTTMDNMASDARGPGIHIGPGGIEFRFGRPGHGPGHRYTCVAQNARGAQYRGFGRNAQGEAMWSCRRDSRFPCSCRIVWCR